MHSRAANLRIIGVNIGPINIIVIRLNPGWTVNREVQSDLSAIWDGGRGPAAIRLRTVGSSRCKRCRRGRRRRGGSCCGADWRRSRSCRRFWCPRQVRRWVVKRSWLPRSCERYRNLLSDHRTAPIGVVRWSEDCNGKCRDLSSSIGKPKCHLAGTVRNVPSFHGGVHAGMARR